MNDSPVGCQSRATLAAELREENQPAGKLRAIERIRILLRLEREEVSVFSDDINDLEMVAFYPNAVAMGNAVPEIKAAAGFVTRSNDEDGVAFALDELLETV